MINRNEWDAACARLEGLRANIPAGIKEETVRQYHGIIGDLESVSGQSFEKFKIPQDKLQPRVASFRMGSFSGRPGSTTYTKDKYCDWDYFKSQIDALSPFIKRLDLDRQEIPTDGKDYWSMTDKQLESIANKFRIPPWGRSGEQGEHWYIDRTFIIDQLVKRDNALRSGQQPPSVNITVGEMHGSVIQQGNQNATATVTFHNGDERLHDLLKKLEAESPQIPLSDSARGQIGIDIGTINVQLSAPHPESSIISTCLRSIRSILQSAATNAVTSGLVLEIGKLLGP